MNLNELTIEEARTKLDKGETTSLEITKACLARIKKINAELNACLLVDEAGALQTAQEADKKIAGGAKNSLLGIPYLCKDNIMTKGLKTTAASKILENYVAPYDATVIKKLKEAGAVLLGKTNLDEFAHGASTENSAYGPTKNPRDLSRVPGGSSGGSAAAVAANMCLFAIGSDTGGSIRYPASFCGLVGLKPSYGRVSRFGLLSMTSSTDVIGALTKTVYDNALVMEIIAGPDELDATTAPEKVSSANKIYSRPLKNIDTNSKPLQGLKIGLPQEYFLDGANPELIKKIRAAAQKLAALGAELIDVSLPYTKYSIPVYYLITPSEISSNLARFDGIGWGLAEKGTQKLQEFYRKNRGVGFGPEAKRRIMLGTYALSAGYFDAYYKKAQAVRNLIIADFAKVFKKVDFLLTPTAPHVAFKIGEQVDNPLAMYLEDIFVAGASLAGLAAISVPAGELAVEDGGRDINGAVAKSLPIGVQLIAPPLGEAEILRVASFLEK
jgi:aspartyl-tRNA(Asn)/glutamyl-tRNA(Gln) amidotransferase subunit A